MSPTPTINIYIRKSSTFSLSATYVNDEGQVVDLTNYNLSGQLREYPESSDSINFNVINGGANGRITLTLAAEQTANISYTHGVYEVKKTNIFNSGDTTTILYGDATIYKDVTRLPWLNAGILAQIIIFTNTGLFPTTGSNKYLYLSAEDNRLYRWADDTYVSIGEKGDKGDTGAAAGFGAPTSSTIEIATNVTPSVSVSASGTDIEKIFSFLFSFPHMPQWFKGTAVIGTGSSIYQVVTGSKPFDFYINTDTSTLYQAVSTHTWNYVCSLSNLLIAGEGIVITVGVDGRQTISAPLHTMGRLLYGYLYLDNINILYRLTNNAMQSDFSIDDNGELLVTHDGNETYSINNNMELEVTYTV